MIIGASAGLGRALAEELARRGHDLVLVASDARDLDPLAADLRIRHGRRVAALALDLASTSAAELRAEALRELGGGIDALLLVSGASDLMRDYAALDEGDVSRLIAVNFEAPTRIALAFLPDLLMSPRGSLVGIGTVAQVRPRGSNTVYAASKQAFEFVIGGIRQRTSGTSLRVQFYRCGFMATQLTFGQTGIIPRVDPARLAPIIADGLRGDFIGRHLPRWWAAIMLVYRCLPWFVFKRMKG